MDLDSPEDDPIIFVDESEGDDKVDKDEGIHSTSNVKTKDASASKPSSPRSSLPTALKELPTKFNELAEDIKGFKNQVHELEIELLGDLKEIPTKLENFTKTVTSLTSQVTELKTLQWELTVEFLPLPTQVFNIASKKVGDTNVPLAGRAGTIPAEGEKNTNQATISQLFQRRADKNAKKTNLNKQPESTTPLTTPIITPIIPTTTYKQSPFFQSSPKSPSQPEGEQTKKDKGKKAMSLKDNKEESSESDLDDENTSYKIEEEAKAEAAKQEGEVRRAELVDLLGPEVVSKYYNAKLQYDKYYDKMLNRRAKSRITNCDVLTRKGLITLKVYREDSTSEIIPDFKASDLHLGEWGEVVKAFPNRTEKG
ncbi:hypothetical protein Tco_1201015 [Tanacetum coccineum]